MNHNINVLGQAEIILERIDRLLEDEPSRKVLRLYGRALADALAKKDLNRLEIGVGIVGPMVEAVEHLDLVDV